MSVCAVVGGQFGSEAKGNVVGKLARDYAVHIRAGAANAGHTVYVDGERHVCQQLPVAAYANPTARLVLGPGALISPAILRREVEALVEWRRKRKIDRKPVVYVDWRAHMVTDKQIKREADSDLAKRIGSTSAIAREGIGEAQADRVKRVGLPIATAAEILQKPDWMVVCDTVNMLREANPFATPVLLEGTQGAGLSLTTGFYPYVTSRDTTAAGLTADCGMNPRQLDRVVMVVRSYPIRVAGNSGPFWSDSKEIDWERLGIDPDQERTTVTKKVRRVATFSHEQVEQAAWLNGATEIAFMFADYLDKGIANLENDTPAEAVHFGRFQRVNDLIDRIERVTGVPVTMVGTGRSSILLRKSGLNIERLTRAS